MSPMTAEQLADRLVNSAEEVLAKVDPTQTVTIVAAILFLKRVTDQPDRYPIRDRDPLDTIMRSSDPDRVLNELLKETTHDFDHRSVDAHPHWDLKPTQIRRFAYSLADISLSDNDLEFPDTVGMAYDLFFSRTTEKAGKLGGLISTPDSVAELMVRITAPEAGESICDPFAGVGGFLTLARDYVRENRGDTAEVKLFGQEISTLVWFLANLNLRLHAIRNNKLTIGDTLENPAHISEDGRLMLFDRVLTHAPFSMNYDKREISHRERLRYGMPSEHGRADLVIVQHVLATLKANGLGVVLAPLGVLFRSGPEAGIRRGMIEDGRIDTIIGLGPSILPNTSIPACIMVLRGPAQPISARHGEVLFINAEPELTRSHGIAKLDPELIQKIVDVFHDRAQLPGFSRTVSIAEIEANDFNLGIRLYTDQAQPPDTPRDAMAIISGGVPRREVKAAKEKFDAFGIDPTSLFFPDDAKGSGDPPHPLRFYEEGYKETAREIAGLTVRRESEFKTHCQAWWDRTSAQFTRLAKTRRLLSARPALIASFGSELLSDGLLDEYQLRGAFAAWWSAWHDDLRVLGDYGFVDVLDRWLASGLVALGEGPSNRVLNHLGTDLVMRAQTQVTAERQKLVDLYLSWGERYGTSLHQLAADEQDARDRLEDRLRSLGYVERWRW